MKFRRLPFFPTLLLLLAPLLGAQTLTTAEALKGEGKTFSYFTDPGEGHGFAQREHRLDPLRRQFEFLQNSLHAPRGGPR